MTTSPITDSIAYTELTSRLREAGTVGSIQALLSWDQEVLMPDKAAASRADQLAWLARTHHEKKTDPALADLIASCEHDERITGDPREAANLREIRRDYDRATKLPADLVGEITRATSSAMHTWREARVKSDWAMFRPALERVVDLHRRKAECYGAPEGGVLYDALVEDFEPGMTSAEIGAIFTPLRERLREFIGTVTSSSTKPPEPLRHVRLPVDRQVVYNNLVAVALGFDDKAGRLDTSTHPFSEPIAPGDTRMTTRYTEDTFLEGLLATIHETGHSVYEQQLPKDERFGQPLGEAVSLGIHESQSRLLENQVGRSRAFWRWALPKAQEIFGEPMTAVTLDDAVGSANRVVPSFIRVEADETTYGIHVMLRFDIERMLFAGDLSVADIPAYWNERMQADLGVTPPDDRRGCLQDIHWSMGALGYFPTYLLGSLHACQMWEVIHRDLPDLDESMAKGDFTPLIAWLKEHVHSLGRQHRAGDLIERISGKPLSADPFMAHLEAKVGPLYGL
jgi:carboxypeptidase Taq